MVTRDRVPVGAHYGWRDWLVQRVTAVIMAAYTVLILFLLLWFGGLDRAAWQATFANELFRIASFVFMLALLWHAWIGVRNISMDYVKPTALRIPVLAVLATVLVAYIGWTLRVLWP